MSTKIITLAPRFDTGEPTVQLVASWGRGGRTLREQTSLHMSKTASKSPAMDYIRTVEPEPGKSIVLIVGLGDHETYGPNRNGDGFPSEPVAGKIASDQVLTKHYQSYKNAHVFEHHVNHDPKKAIGKVKMAFWNPHMRRVEVLEDFSHDKAPHLLEKIAAGEHPSKSMGCRIPYDVCTMCGNRAVTRKDYCDHLKFEMGKIYADGQQAAALNPCPNFFDSSWVTRPADRIGHMLKKVARDDVYNIRLAGYELNDMVESTRAKAAALGKAADMEKTLTGAPEAVSTNTGDATLKLLKNYSENVAPGEEKALPASDVRITIEYTPDEAVGTSDAMGLPMGIKDLVKYFMGRMGSGEPTDEELGCACKHAGAVMEIFAEYPRAFDDALKVAGLLELNVNEKLASAMWPASTMVADRKLVDSPIGERRLPSNMSTQTPNSDTLSFTDPQGKTLYTNMGLARKATRRLQPRARVTKAARGAGTLGMGALLGTAGAGALMTGNRTPLRTLAGGAAVGAGAFLGAKGLHTMGRRVRQGDLPGKQIMTNEGHTIPALTEMKAAAWQPEMLYTVLRQRDGADTLTPLSPTAKIALHAAVRTAEVHDDLSPILGPTLNLEKIAFILEQSISTLA